jgi:hypothetical protein
MKVNLLARNGRKWSRKNKNVGEYLTFQKQNVKIDILYCLELPISCLDSRGAFLIIFAICLPIELSLVPEAPSIFID